MQIRELKGKDARLIAPAIGRAFNNVELDTEKQEIAGKKVIAYLLENEVENLWSWLADLAEMSVQELDDASIDTPINILKEVYNQNKDTFFLKLGITSQE